MAIMMNEDGGSPLDRRRGSRHVDPLLAMMSLFTLELSWMHSPTDEADLNKSSVFLELLDCTLDITKNDSGQFASDSFDRKLKVVFTK